MFHFIFDFNSTLTSFYFLPKDFLQVKYEDSSDFIRFGCDADDVELWCGCSKSYPTTSWKVHENHKEWEVSECRDRKMKTSPTDG